MAAKIIWDDEAPAPTQAAPGKGNIVWDDIPQPSRPAAPQESAMPTGKDVVLEPLRLANEALFWPVNAARTTGARLGAFAGTLAGGGSLRDAVGGANEAAGTVQPIGLADPSITMTTLGEKVVTPGLRALDEQLGGTGAVPLVAGQAMDIAGMKIGAKVAPKAVDATWKASRGGAGVAFNKALEAVSGATDLRGKTSAARENLAQKAYDAAARNAPQTLENIFNSNLYKLLRVKNKNLGLGRDKQVAFERKAAAAVDEILQQQKEGRLPQVDGSLAETTQLAKTSMENIWSEIQPLVSGATEAGVVRNVSNVAGALRKLASELDRQKQPGAAAAVRKRAEVFEQSPNMTPTDIQGAIANINRQFDYNKLPTEQKLVAQAEMIEGALLREHLDTAIQTLPDQPGISELKARYGAVSALHDTLAQAGLKELQGMASKSGFGGLHRTALVGGIGGVSFGSPALLAAAASTEIIARLRERGMRPSVQANRMFRARKAIGPADRPTFPQLADQGPRMVPDPSTGQLTLADQGTAVRTPLTPPPLAPETYFDPAVGARIPRNLKGD